MRRLPEYTKIDIEHMLYKHVFEYWWAYSILVHGFRLMHVRYLAWHLVININLYKVMASHKLPIYYSQVMVWGQIVILHVEIWFMFRTLYSSFDDVFMSHNPRHNTWFNWLSMMSSITNYMTLVWFSTSSHV